MEREQQDAINDESKAMEKLANKRSLLLKKVFSCTWTKLHLHRTHPHILSTAWICHRLMMSKSDTWCHLQHSNVAMVICIVRQLLLYEQYISWGHVGYRLLLNIHGWEESVNFWGYLLCLVCWLLPFLWRSMIHYTCYSLWSTHVIIMLFHYVYSRKRRPWGR